MARAARAVEQSGRACMYVRGSSGERTPRPVLGRSERRVASYGARGTRVVGADGWAGGYLTYAYGRASVRERRDAVRPCWLGCGRLGRARVGDGSARYGARRVYAWYVTRVCRLVERCVQRGRRPDQSRSIGWAACGRDYLHLA